VEVITYIYRGRVNKVFGGVSFFVSSRLSYSPSTEEEEEEEEEEGNRQG